MKYYNADAIKNTVRTQGMLDNLIQDGFFVGIYQDDNTAEGLIVVDVEKHIAADDLYEEEFRATTIYGAVLSAYERIFEDD